MYVMNYLHLNERDIVFPVLGDVEANLNYEQCEVTFFIPISHNNNSMLISVETGKVDGKWRIYGASKKE
jgi:hypothetical protein